MGKGKRGGMKEGREEEEGWKGGRRRVEGSGREKQGRGGMEEKNMAQLHLPDPPVV